MAEVVPIKTHKDFSRQTKRSAAGCLKECRALNPTEVLVIGIDDQGALFVQGSPPDPMNAMWLMERAKKRLLRSDE